MLPGRYAVGFSSDSGDVPLMPLLRDEIRDHSAEEMLFIRRAAIAFLLVVVCFGVLIVNLYHLQEEQHDFYQTRSNQNDIKMLPIAPSRGLIFDRNGIPLVQNITLYRLQVIPSKIPDMAALLQQLTPIVDLTPDDIASFRDDMHHTSRYKAVPQVRPQRCGGGPLRGQRIPFPRRDGGELPTTGIPLRRRAGARGGLCVENQRQRSATAGEKRRRGELRRRPQYR